MARDALVGVGGMPLSAEILRCLLESSQDVLYAVALDPVRMLYATPAFALRMGLPEDFLARGYAFSEYLGSVHPDDQGRVAGIMDAIVASRSDADLPDNPACYRLRTPEGGWRVISDSYRLLRGPGGVPQTLIGNARDVSEQSEARQALAEREAHFRLLTENSRDLFFTLRFPDFRIEYLSPSYTEITGYSPEEHYADPGVMFRVVAPQWREQVARWLEDIGRGEVQEFYEYQILDRSGRLRWLHQRQVLVPAPDGRGTLLQGVATDVTDLRLAQQALEQNEARFRSLAENSRDIFFSFRLPEGRCEFISSKVADISGHTPQEFYDDPGLFLRCAAPHWRQAMAGWMAEISRGVVRDRYEFQVLDRHGRLRWIVERLVLVPAPDGQGLLLQGVAADITEEREAREALRVSEERYRELAEGWLNQAVIRINLHSGRCEYVSPGIERLFGFAPQEFYRSERSIVERCVAPEWREAVREWAAEAKVGALRPEYEFELIDAWGQRRWVHQLCTLLHAADGTPEVVQGVLYDNTERHRLEDELRASQAFLDCIIEQSPMSMWISDERGTLIRTNQALRELFQVSEEEVVGRYNIFKDGQLEEHGFMPQIRQIFDAGGTTRLMLPYDTARIEGLALERPCAAYLHATISAVQDAQGTTTNLIIQHLDITEHKRLEAELAASERKYRTLHESMRDGIAAVDLDGCIREHNNAYREMLGYSDEEMATLTYRDVTPPEWHEPEARIIREQVFVRGYSDVYEKEYRRKDGTLFPVSMRVYLYADEAGQPARFWAIVRDITEQKRAEVALRESEARFRLIVETANEGIWTVDAEQRATFVNAAMARMLGYSVQEMLGARTEAFLFPEDMETHTRRMELRRAGQDEVYERRFLRKDGSTLWTLASAKPLLDDRGRFCGAFAMFIDITERRRAEEALLASERRFSELIRYSSDSITILDQDGIQVFVSEAVERMLGYKASELMGIPVIEEMLHPEDRERVAAAFAAILRDGTGGAQYRHRHKNGSWVYLEAWGTNQLDNQDIRGVVVNVRDITERRRAEAALRLSEARYALALKGANDGIWDWDLVEDQVYYSDRWKEIIGYAPDELKHDAQEWLSRIHPEDLDLVVAANQRCIRGDVPIFQVEYRLRHKDGTYRWIFGRGAALAEASGRVVRMAGAHTDITARKQAEEALFKSERLSRKLLESMHEGVWAVDANRRTTFVNERLCAMLGYVSAELMNMSPTDVLEWPQRHVAKTQLSDLEAGYSGATDYVLIRKDGSRFPAHVVSSPVMEEQGRFEGLVCGVVDLTERARMEHELRRNQARFEALYELSRLTPATEHQLASFTLREAIRLTDSSAGVLFFVSEDALQLVPKAWETAGPLDERHQVPSFPTTGALPWAMVAQSALPLLINDFTECAHLVPPGHPPVSRFLGVPALDGSRPAAVLGLTGKSEPYTAEDTLHVTLLLDGMWREVRTRRDEERIRASLSEKEALLHEVHHRVKNNLQVISSLMDMAGRRLSSAEARRSLTELRDKVQAMSLIHAQLHGAGSDGGISLERFVRALFHQLREVYAGGLDLSLRLQLGDLNLSLDQAVPLGLALNETLTNVFKHACPPASEGTGRANRVEVRAERDAGGQVRIEIEDNGPGLPPGFEPDSADSLGLKLTRGLVRHQLRGELTFRDTAPGLCVCIRFQPHMAK